MTATNPWAKRVERADWAAATDEVNTYGCALLTQLLTKKDCAQLAALYDDAPRFRSTINMARYRFGEGEYRYFAAPFPEPVDALRHALYPKLLPIARDWYAKLGRRAEWPDRLDEWLGICRDAGQTKPTPILLRYDPYTAGSRADLHHPRSPCRVHAWLVCIAGAARRLGDPVRSAVHARPGLPRRRVTPGWFGVVGAVSAVTSG